MSAKNSILPPSDAFKQRATLSSTEEYHRLYTESISNPDSFWSEMAKTELVWEKKWSSVCSYDWQSVGLEAKPFVSWFDGGELNVSVNCLDRHVASGFGEKAAIIWEGEKHGERIVLTYRQLLEGVSRVANVLEKLGIKKASTVGIFMPMVPEVVMTMLACARIGAIHSVVFSAFSAEALRTRMQDCQACLLITADGSFYGGKILPIKPKVDEALAACPSIRRVLVLNRTQTPIAMQSGRDSWWHEEMAAEDISAVHIPSAFPSETPLFTLYTSGSTGKPKGVLHTSAGYLLYAHTTCKYYFDLRSDDIYWCTADVGWITGHSYFVYGPLSNGVTCLMFEGAPLQPDAERSWKLIEENKVSVYYTAPTAIRSFMKLGDELPQKYDLSSLRLLGSVGEPINPEAWLWYYETIGGARCPVVDTWWQTETGGHMLATLPGAMDMKPGSTGKPFFGVVPAVLKDDGSAAGINEDGILVITRPWPGMLRGVYGDSVNALIKETYFSRFPGVFFTGDGARVDADGYYWLLGRIDDVLSVSGHRLATAELESALVSHRSVAEAAVIGYPHEIKGQGIYCFVSLKSGRLGDSERAVQLRAHVRREIGPIATPDKIQFCDALPKTRSGKIMRRILRKLAEAKREELGDLSTLADPTVVDAILKGEVF